jgi:peptide/nickel transport system permease protein
MSSFVLPRLLQGIITILIVSLIVFLFMHLAGDPAALLLPEEASPDDIAQLRTRLGLDRPLYEQYFLFMRDFWWGDNIKSFRYDGPLRPLILEGLARTLALAGGAMLASVVLAVPLGTLAALKRGSNMDVSIRLFAVLGQSLPSFWVAMMLVLVFAVQLRLFPVSGLGAQNAVLPLVTLTFFQVAVLLRLFRSEVLEAIHQDYVRTARAKGLAEAVVINRHIMKNAALPVLTMTGLQLSNLILGAVVVEPIFAWPGLGYLMVNAVFLRDYPLVVGGTIIAAVFVTAINLIVDLLHGWLDPRIHFA